MSKPYWHLRLVLSGTIKGSQTWSCGTSWLPDTTIGSWYDQTALSTWLTARGAGFTTWWNGTDGPGKQNPSDVLATKLTVYDYPPNADAADLQADYFFPSPLVGSGVVIGPTQGSVAISTLTGVPGRHYRGRFYVPATGANFISGHLLATQLTSAFASLSKTLFDGINSSTIAAVPIRMIVASQTATPRPVTTLRVDNEMDIQRRRADKLLATASSSSVLA